MKSVKTEITIHLNNYASCFATQMCAYMTGAISNFDEDIPGAVEAKNFQEDLSIGKELKQVFRGNISSFPSDYGIDEYYEIISTPGWYNHGMDGIYEDIPENDEIALKDYKNKTISYLKNMYSGDILKEKIKAVQHEKKVNKYLSEQGFVITINSALDKEQISFLENRAKEYASQNKIKILTFEVDEIVLNLNLKIKK